MKPGRRTQLIFLLNDPDDPAPHDAIVPSPILPRPWGCAIPTAMPHSGHVAPVARRSYPQFAHNPRRLLHHLRILLARHIGPIANTAASAHHGASTTPSMEMPIGPSGLP